MYSYPNPNYLQMLEQRLRYLEDRVLLAERELQTVRETMQQLKPVHIDNITYKVQELAVNELSGTLNVGLTALADPKQWEQWANMSGEEQEQNVVLENLQGGSKEETEHGG